MPGPHGSAPGASLSWTAPQLRPRNAMNRQAKLILIVEDDSAFRTVLARHLEALGYLTLLAGSVREALDRLMIRPALVLLDLGLPDASGWEVASRLRRLSRDVPVIVLS